MNKNWRELPPSILGETVAQHRALFAVLAASSSLTCGPDDLSADFTSTPSRRWRLYASRCLQPSRVAPRGAGTTRAKRTPGRAGGCGCPCPSKTIVPLLLPVVSRGVRMPLPQPQAWTRLRPRSTRLTLPATLADVRPAKPRDRVGANPRQNVQCACAHSGGVATFRGQSLVCQDR